MFLLLLRKQYNIIGKITGTLVKSIKKLVWLGEGEIKLRIHKILQDFAVSKIK